MREPLRPLHSYGVHDGCTIYALEVIEYKMNLVIIASIMDEEPIKFTAIMDEHSKVHALISKVAQELCKLKPSLMVMYTLHDSPCIILRRDHIRLENLNQTLDSYGLIDGDEVHVTVMCPVD